MITHPVSFPLLPFLGHDIALLSYSLGTVYEHLLCLSKSCEIETESRGSIFLADLEKIYFFTNKIMSMFLDKSGTFHSFVRDKRL